jgi:chromate transport protein ChrA
MFDILKSSHSGLRWVVLGLLLAAIIGALAKMKSGKYEKSSKMINLFAMIVLHLQVTLGIVLAFFSGKVNYGNNWMSAKNVNGVAEFRFFGMEHILIMVIAAVILTIGRKKAESASDPGKQHKTILVWYTIGLLLILAGIPWPFRGFTTGWF